MKEFDFIEKYLVPLTNGYKGSLKLKDDIAILPFNKQYDYVVTLDTIVENIHFLQTANAKQIANKLIRSNLSDIASAGAKATHYMMTGSLMPEAWIKEFTDELKKLNKEFSISLIGGDTVKSKEKFFSVTMFGKVEKGKALLRSSAKKNDAVFISGVIGEAWLGLQILNNKMKLKNNKYYINKHYCPEPKLKLIRKIKKYVNSCTDISDGFLKDLNNILVASNKSAIIYADKIPLALKDNNFLLEQLTAGDDYQLVFTANRKYINILHGYGCVYVGDILANDKAKKITIIGHDNKIIKFKNLGYEHE
jgi:thiamine-monophosphate kinase